MRRRKNAQRAALNARKEEDSAQEKKRIAKGTGLEIAKRVKKVSRKK